MPNISPIVLVSGSHSGIGFEIVRQLLAQGITVILTARTMQQAEEVVQKLDTVRHVVAQQLDVTDDASVARLVQVVENEFGRLDILVNNAGILIDRDQHSGSMDMAVAKEVLGTNLFGAWRLYKAFLPLMKRNGYGHIVNISAGLGSFVEMGERSGIWPAHCLSKMSLNALTLQLSYRERTFS